MSEFCLATEPVPEMDAGLPAAKVVYRVGDRVRIIEPCFVVRVGYPLSWPMLREEVSNDPRLLQTIALWGVEGHGKAWYEILDGICRALVRKRGFGGRERSVFTVNKPDAAGQVSEVHKKRNVQTGTYHAPHYSSGGYYSEPEWEPGYLDHVKTRVLLATDFGEIERCYVERA